MNVICFGDSNTYGYDPRSFFGCRYDTDCRWVDILSEKTGWNVDNFGMNGQEIPRNEIIIPQSTDLLIIMLGTNDLLQGSSVNIITDRMTSFLQRLSVVRSNILLIAPPALQLGEWVQDECLIAASRMLAKAYHTLCKQFGIQFLDSGVWNIPIAYDGVHFTEAGHKIFAEGLYKELIK